MLNLTPDPIKFRTESGEEFVVEPSGYVASVEYEESCVGVHVFRHEPYVGEWGHTDAALDSIDEIPIVEKTPLKIVFDWYDLGISLHGIMWQGSEIEKASLLLVTSKVAEAAVQPRWCSSECPGLGNGACCGKRERHPLSSRMVWADDWHAKKEDTSISGTAYHALQRVPQS